jgi:hypothetical protein
VRAKEFFAEFQEFDTDSLVQFLTCYANKVDEDADMIVHEDQPEEDAAEGEAPAAAAAAAEPNIDVKTMNRAEIFAEVSAHCVEAIANELDADEELSMEVAAGKLSLQMLGHLDKAERVLSTMYVDA